MNDMRLVAVAVMLFAAACGRKPEASIEAPANGDMVTGPSVLVRLAAEGTTIAPVADQRPGGVHFHLFLDTDPTPEGAAIPVGMPGISHLGGGQTEVKLDSVPPGDHRLIVVLGDNAHVTVPGQKTDTVRFMVH